MEETVFRLPAVRRALVSRVVEARLHSDHGDEPIAERNQALQRAFIGYVSNPYFVIVDPAEPRKMLRHHDFTADAEEFVRFLEGR